MARIGIFDSGLGGLSILRDIRALLPSADITYYGDTANVPYGGRPTVEVERLSLAALEVVRRSNPDIVVVACNTVTSVAIQVLRSAHTELPIAGVVPVIKQAGETSKAKKISVLATVATLSSHSYASLKQTFAEGVDVLELALPEWVTMVEQGDLDRVEVKQSVAHVASKVQEFGADVIALGCTHFVFLRSQIESALPGVRVLDSGQAVARQTQRLLEKNHVVTDEKSQGSVEYLGAGADDAAVARIHGAARRRCPLAEQRGLRCL